MCLVGEEVADDVSYIVMSSFVECRGRGRVAVESLTRFVRASCCAEGIARVVGGFGSLLNIGTDSTIGSVEVEWTSIGCFGLRLTCRNAVSSEIGVAKEVGTSLDEVPRVIDQDDLSLEVADR